MFKRRPASERNGRTLGVLLLTLSLVHTPLPQPDFHNIRHHDAPGEVCEYHDHLLRWHPSAGSDDDVAVLHWHWFLPAAPGTDPAVLGSGLALHAHTPAWQAASWDDGPRVTPDTASRLVFRPAPCPLDLPVALTGPAALGAAPTSGAHPPLGFGATFAPRISFASLLQRWDC